MSGTHGEITESDLHCTYGSRPSGGGLRNFVSRERFHSYVSGTVWLGFESSLYVLGSNVIVIQAARENGTVLPCIRTKYTRNV